MWGRVTTSVAQVSMLTSGGARVKGNAYRSFSRYARRALLSTVLVAGINSARAKEKSTNAFGLRLFCGQFSAIPNISPFSWIFITHLAYLFSLRAELVQSFSF